MEKYIECHNCQNQYDCERTYLGGCTDGKEWEDDKDINVRSKKILANRVYSDTTLKKWSKEDLIEHIRILEHNWACAEENLNNSVKNSEKIFYEQKAEIERLTEELDLANETIDRNNKRYERVSIERQKALDRVDYLEDALLDKIRRNEELITAIKQAEQQSVKDTAKEIYELIDAVKEVFPNDYRGYDMAHGWSMCVDKLKEIIKSKGAEVE